MSLSRLSPQRLWFWTILGSLLYLLLHAVEDQFISIHLSTWLFAAVIMAFSVWTGVRRHSRLIILIGLTAGTLAWHYELASHLETALTHDSLLVHMIALGVLVVFSLPVALLHRKRMRTWYRWLFARAAEHATGQNGSSDSGNGTAADDADDDRPCLVRRARYTRDELEGLAHFLAARRIAIPAWEENTLALLLPGEQHFFSDGDADDRSEMTRVTFAPAGDIHARIAPADVRNNGEGIAYGALCRGLGNAMYDLLQRHRLGERDLILREVHDDTREATAILVIVGSLVFVLALLLHYRMI